MRLITSSRRPDEDTASTGGTAGDSTLRKELQ
jgi:hypothetical protein